ncbi:SurA N-terminal domain-containing protein [Mucilaginibacter sp. HMF5004]|uniref:peptidylprolyl isomerase n=1 Tax=Mucilaginibacter rivuli TaxID=2857527 RepID=UPI001C5E64D8|nr:peptidylprolyl isomerase [Mucilaginibacter rivuli]MBW4888603.1 SurA N-terminal domain-containing protein [Mucilaginibacter rivuli]
MAVMGFLRDRGGKIVAITIGLSLFAFIVGEVMHSGSSFFRDSAANVGEVDGEKITTVDFNKKVEINTQNFKQQSGQTNINAQITNYIQATTWNQIISKTILDKEIDKLGLAIGLNETKSMISGPTPNQQIVQAFTNQQTGQFDKDQLNTFLHNLESAKANDPIKDKWNDFVAQMQEAKKGEKYLNLVKNGLYVNSLDAKDDYENKNKLANFKYTGLDYASIPDNKVTLTDNDYQNYYDEHKNEFKTKEELRSFDYVVFDASPTQEDSAVVKEQVAKLLPDFKASTNDSLFVAINADTKAPLVFQKKGQLEPKLDTLMFNAAPGFIYGPYFSNGAFKLAKLVDSRIGPDSVKARHILLAPGTPLKTADSLKTLLASGKKTFAELATANSMDKGSAAKGGDLGTFGRGAMIPVFEDAVFNGHKGDIKIVQSQYGIHIIEIQEQKGSSKVVKVAVVDKPLTPSSKTETAAHSKAQQFLASLTKGNFDAEVKKEGLVKKTAADVSGVAGSLPGLDNTRDLVRWAFNKASVGDFTDEVYESGYQGIVAVLTEVKPVGVLSLDAVKKQIKPAVLNKVKAKQLSDKLAAALNGAGSIDQVAQKAGTTVMPVQNVVFANPVIPGASQENKLIGAIFGSKPNKLSKPVEGEKGVFVYVVDGFTTPTPLNNSLRQKEQLGQAIVQRAEGGVLEALKDKANVKDYRAKVL